MLMAGATANASGYTIPYSARFVSGNSAYLTRTPGVAGNKQTFTISTWFKFGTLPSTAERRVLFSANSTNPYFRIEFDDTTVTGALMVYQYNGAAYDFQLLTTQVFRDPGAWYHVVVAFDTTQGTAANRIKVYINGAQITAFGTASYPSASLNTYWNATNAMRIGRGFGTDRFDGYLANTTGVDGSQLTPSSFGQTNTSGVWVPKAYTGTYGTNGFLMAFANSAALGTDTSGNGNTFTSSGLTAADQMSDTPTLNYCTLNPLLKYANVTASQGNLLATPSGTNVQFIGTTIAIPTTGKWVWWAQRQSGTSVNLGIGDATAAAGLDVNQGTNLIFDVNTGVFSKYYSGASQSAPSSFTAPGASLIRLEYDATNDNLYIYDDNVLAKTVTNTGIRANAVGPIFPIFGPYASTPATVLANFGGNGLPETPTSGYVALNTTNLPSPAIPDGDAGFAHVLATETNIVATLAAARSGWTDYIECFRNRTSAEEWVVRFSDDTGNFMSFDDSDAKAAFPTLSGSDNWYGMAIREGAAYGVYSASVAHTNGGDTNTAHGLTSPTGRYVCIVKREDSAGSWYMSHPTLTSGYNILIDTVAAEQNSTVYAAVSSTNGTIKSAAPTGTYRVWVIAEIPGFSFLGQHTGNASADGPCTYMSMSPAMDICRQANAIENIVLKNALTDTYNLADHRINLDQPAAEDTSANGSLDFLAGGIKERSSNGLRNASGGRYLHITFAIRPLGGVGVSPATAR